MAKKKITTQIFNAAMGTMGHRLHLIWMQALETSQCDFRLFKVLSLLEDIQVLLVSIHDDHAKDKDAYALIDTLENCATMEGFMKLQSMRSKIRSYHHNHSS